MASKAESSKAWRNRMKDSGLCTQCGKNKPNSGRVRCGVCRAIHAVSNTKKEYKPRQGAAIEKHNTDSALRRRRLILQTYAAYGGKCVCCGETYWAYLQLDHVNDDGGEHRRSLLLEGKAPYKSVEWAIKNNYPDTLQLLCANCHQAKTRRVSCIHSGGLSWE